MLNNRLNESMIGSAKVIVDILPGGKVIPNTKITPTSITIHNTGNIGAAAKNNHNYMKNCNKDGSRIASWHFTVDDKEIYQAQSTNYKCYHAGNSTGNNTSIGIEICMFNDAARQKKCYENAIALVKILMSYHKFDISKVKRHKDWSGKHCPAWLIEGKFGYTWDWFKQQCGASAAPAPNPAPSTPSVPANFTVKIKVDSLNIRKGPGTSYAVAGSVAKGGVYTITETNGNWGKLKSGAGWINISDDYVEKSGAASSEFKVKIKVATLNVRKGPGASYAVATTVVKGGVYTITEVQNGWGKLKSGAGWINVSDSYVDRV